MLRKSAMVSVFLLACVSLFGQTSGRMVGTVTAIDTAKGRVMLTPDDDRNSSLTIETDAVTTQYNGFGGTINGAPEVFVGSTGFANIRTGDRLEIRGSSRSYGVIAAEYVTLVGRPVPASQTGVGQTRTPNEISPPTANPSGPSATMSTERPSHIEGIVRQVNANEGRVVIETDQRQMITIRGTNATPVYYRNNVYRIGNLEPGDRIRVEPESGTAGREIRARVVDVLQSVQDAGATPAQIGSVSGRVTNIDRRNDIVRVDTGREEVRVDLSTAVDTTGRRVRAADLQTGDRVDLSGNYNGDTFVATTVRFVDETPAPSAPVTVEAPRPVAAAGPLGAVTIYGTVSQSLTSSPQLVIRDQNGQSVRLYVLDDFVVRTRSGGTTTADRLHDGDGVVVKAYRDSDGNYIAQTIRMR